MTKTVAAAAMALVLALPNLASAQFLTFYFTGTVSGTTGGRLASGPFAAGQEVTGSFTFDPTAVDASPLPEVGAYAALTSLNLSIAAAGYTVTASPGLSGGAIVVLNDQEGTRDEYRVNVSRLFMTLTAPPIADLTLDGITMVLRDRTTLAFDSDALPLEPPQLSDFTFGAELFIDFVGPFGTETVFVDLTSLTGPSVTTLLDQLVSAVIEINARTGISNSLDEKLANVMRAIDDANARNDIAAINAMNAFINSVEAQNGRHLTAAQAARLLDIANAIVAALDR